MVDILFPVRCEPARGRRDAFPWLRAEFATAALAALKANTNPLLARILIHEDARCLGPVAIMNDYLSRPGSEVFAKIDSDTIVPPGWLEAGLEVMGQHPELGLLGIEPPASRTAAPWARARPGESAPAPELGAPAGYACTVHIGGIGLMRRSAFATPDRMRPHSIYGGFTDWQLRHPEVIKGWIVPPLKVFLLDRLPIEPWASLSKEYIRKGWQRAWTNYKPEDSELWSWWLKSREEFSPSAALECGGVHAAS